MKKLIVSILLLVLALVGWHYHKHIRYWYQRATLRGHQLDPAPVTTGWTVHGSTFATEADYRRATNTTDSVSRAMEQRRVKGSFKAWGEKEGR